MRFRVRADSPGFFSVATIARSRHLSAQGVHWEYLVPIAAVHLLACLAVVPWCFSWSGVILAAIGTNFFGTLGINLCYHRLLSHRSLTVPVWLERTLATIALCSLEDTPCRWVANHRLHHRHSDEEPDPHSPRDGVVWAHMGWLFERVPHRRSAPRRVHGPPPRGRPPAQPRAPQPAAPRCRGAKRPEWSNSRKWPEKLERRKSGRRGTSHLLWG